MKVRNTRRPIMVGIFVFVALVLFITAIFTLGGQQSVFARTVTIKAIFNNVEGLKKGNNVWFSGVKVGTVKELKFYGKSDVEITMDIEEHAHEYIRKDAQVVLSSEGFIGSKIIEIVGGTMDYPPVEDGDVLDVKQTVGTTEIMRTLQDNNKNLLEITNDLKVLSDKAVKGEGLIGALFTENEMKQDIESTIGNLQQTSQAAEVAMANLNAFTSKLNRKDGSINKLITDTALYGKLQATANNLQQVSQQASRLTENLNQATSKLNQTGNTAGMLLNDEQFANELRGTMTNLEKGTAELNETLEALQRTFLLRRQVRKMQEEQEGE